MNLRQRQILATGLHRHTDRPAMQTSARVDPMAWVAAIAVCAALLCLFAAADYRDQLTEVSECTAARR